MFNNALLLKDHLFKGAKIQMFVFRPQGSASELWMELSNSNLRPKSSLTPQVTAHSGCELLINDVCFEFCAIHWEQTGS